MNARRDRRVDEAVLISKKGQIVLVEIAAIALLDGRQRVREGGYSWTSSFSNLPMMPAMRSQSAVSFASCFRPLLVIE
jgi:hypothetical protein